MACVALMTGCGGDSAGPDPVDPTLPAKITILPVASTKIFIGLTLQLQAVVTDGNGDTLASAPVTWSSDGPDNASISSQGLVTEIEHGTGDYHSHVASELPLTRSMSSSWPPTSISVHTTLILTRWCSTRSLVATSRASSMATFLLFWSSAGAMRNRPAPATAQESDGGNVQITFTIGSLFGRLNLVIAPAPVAHELLHGHRLGW